MKRNIQDIIGKKQQIHCTTKEQISKIVELIKALGNNDYVYTTVDDIWEMKGDKTSFAFMHGFIGFASVEFHTEQGYTTIIPASEFLEGEEQPVLFRTEDGVDIKDNEKYYTIENGAPSLRYASAVKEYPSVYGYSDYASAESSLSKQKEPVAEQSDPTRLIPFDLTIAKEKPELVRYRNGEKPLEWHYFEKATEKYPVRTVHKNGEIYSHTIVGEEYEKQKTDYDLIMVDDAKEVVDYLLMTSKGVRDVYTDLQYAIDSECSESISIIAIHTRNGYHVKTETVHTYKKEM